MSGLPEASRPRLPLRTFDELVAAVGGATPFTVAGRTLPLAGCRHLIPGYYFPIVSRADLEAKLADLAAGVGPATFGADLGPPEWRSPSGWS